MIFPEDNETARESRRYRRIFGDLDISYEVTDDGETISTIVLGYKGQSLRLYFVEASRNHDAFFSANVARYRDFIANSELWEFVDNGRTKNELENKNCDTVIPVPGQEEKALRKLVDFARAEGYC